jgi:hypothetical protein
MNKREFMQVSWSPQLEEDLRRIVRLAVHEDLDRGQDWTYQIALPLRAWSSAGKVSNVPPPAIELMTPATRAVPQRNR